MGMKRTDTEMINNSLNLLGLHKLEWQSKIENILCKKTLDDNKFEKSLLLPLTDDLLKACAFLKNSFANFTKQLLAVLIWSHGEHLKKQF